MVGIVATTSLLAWSVKGHSQQAKPVEIGTRLELFVDRHLIESANEVELRLKRASRRGNSDEVEPALGRSVLWIYDCDQGWRSIPNVLPWHAPDRRTGSCLRGFFQGRKKLVQTGIRMVSCGRTRQDQYYPGRCRFGNAQLLSAAGFQPRRETRSSIQGDWRIRQIRVVCLRLGRWHSLEANSTRAGLES